MKLLVILNLLVFTLQKGCGQNKSDFDNFFKKDWKLAEMHWDTVIKKDKSNPCSHFFYFKSVRFKAKDKLFSGYFYITREKCDDGINMYPFITRFEMSLKDSVLFVKKVDHMNFNKHYHRDVVFNEIVNFFLTQKLKVKYSDDDLLLNSNSGQARFNGKTKK